MDPLDQLTAQARAELENRTYHMGAVPTPGRGYDDRLTMRLPYSPTTLYKYLALPAHRGGLTHRRLGKSYHISERDVRAFEGHPVSNAA